MDDDTLFDDETNVVGTPELAQSIGITEADARAWANEHGVTRIGNSFAWSREDAESLLEDFEPDESEEDDDEPHVRHVEVEGELDEYEIDDEGDDEDE